MDYKEIVDEQIEILKKRQNDLISNSQGRHDIVCLISKTIADLAEIASRIGPKVLRKTKQDSKTDK